MRKPILFLLIAGCLAAQQPPAEAPKLKLRNELPAAEAAPTEPKAPKQLWIVPAGVKIPIALRQPISTKGARAGDPIYAQTTFPIVLDGEMVIPAGTWVQGVVDNVKRAGRIKGTAELGFHLTQLIYSNGYTLNIAAAIDQVPGDESSSVKEPGTVKHDSEKGKDLERIGTGASQGGQIGALSGAVANKGIRGVGVGGLSGVAAGTLIALLARGGDVKFDAGTAVEIALSHPMAIEPGKATKLANTAAPN